ncbi:hypothetical protein GETHLI_03130 [Geothrix limicola]|uniref:DUF4382 domain-containing protein n=1 Tax=Geothrix limicola TaxID=2927978 RepID=A0ABQ5QBJ9_9BACT|nr:hypothetical protein [Geothrix limicola]GLH71811.1 hypothetical protein GETHLI_03130 [Geothrix limicola]
MTFFPNWRNLGYLVSVLLVALMLSCGGGGSTPPPPPEGNLRVYNGGNLAMWNLHVTRSVSSTWGVDQLAPATLFPGESLTLTGLYPDTYDVEARFSDGSLDRVYDVQIQDGVTTVLTMMDTGNGSVAVFNNSGLTITGIYLTLSTASTWGPNQADQPLYDLQTLTLTGVSPGTYDLKVVFSNGNLAYPPAFSVTSGAVTTLQVN